VLHVPGDALRLESQLLPLLARTYCKLAQHLKLLPSLPLAEHKRITTDRIIVSELFHSLGPAHPFCDGHLFLLDFALECWPDWLAVTAQTLHCVEKQERGGDCGNGNHFNGSEARVAEQGVGVQKVGTSEHHHGVRNAYKH
jgi:hypothetical protein